MVSMTTTTLNLELPALHVGQRQVWDSGVRFRVMACGRRWGKTRLGALLCIAVACQKNRLAWWVAPTYPVASIGWRMIRRMAKQIPRCEVREAERMVTLPGGGAIQVKSADNPDSLRGEGLHFVVVDECAFVKEDAWTEALRPALADKKGGALFISTPKGHNWFWRLWQNANSSQNNEWKAWRFSSYDNPYLDKMEIDAAKNMLPDRTFRQEFLAEFIDDAGGVFSGVRSCVTATVQENGQPGSDYLFGVDWGKSNDFTVICVMDVRTRSLVHMERFNRIDYQVQLGRLTALYERFMPYSIIAEANSIGEPLIEQIQRSGLPVVPFQTTSASKSLAIDDLALAFAKREISIIDNEALIAELEAYEMNRLPSGLMRYSAPAGMHDDCVMSLALAWHGLNHSGRSLLLFGG